MVQASKNLVNELDEYLKYIAMQPTVDDQMEAFRLIDIDIYDNLSWYRRIFTPFPGRFHAGDDSSPFWMLSRIRDVTEPETATLDGFAHWRCK